MSIFNVETSHTYGVVNIHVSMLLEASQHPYLRACIDGTLLEKAWADEESVCSWVSAHFTDVATEDVFPTAFLLACYGGHVDVVEFLLDVHPLPVPTQALERNPLVFACLGGHLHMVRWLVENDTHPRRRTGARTHLTMPYMVSTGVRRAQCAVLWFACIAGKVAPVEYILTALWAALDRDGDGARRASELHRTTNYLWVVVAYGKLQLCEFLLRHRRRLHIEANASPRGAMDIKKSPLWMAAAGGRLTVVQYLVEHGAAEDIVVGDAERRTPLHATAMRGQKAMLQWLCDRALAELPRGALAHPILRKGSYDAAVAELPKVGLVHPLHRRDSYGRSPLWYACRGAHVETALRILEHVAVTECLVRDTIEVCPLHAFPQPPPVLQAADAPGAQQQEEGATPKEKKGKKQQKRYLSPHAYDLVAGMARAKGPTSEAYRRFRDHLMMLSTPRLEARVLAGLLEVQIEEHHTFVATSLFGMSRFGGSPFLRLLAAREMYSPVRRHIAEFLGIAFGVELRHVREELHRLRAVLPSESESGSKEEVESEPIPVSGSELPLGVALEDAAEARSGADPQPGSETEEDSGGEGRGISTAHTQNRRQRQGQVQDGRWRWISRFWRP